MPSNPLLRCFCRRSLNFGTHAKARLQHQVVKEINTHQFNPNTKQGVISVFGAWRWGGIFVLVLGTMPAFSGL